MYKSKLAGLFVAAAVAVTPVLSPIAPASAASDGALGATSTGSIDITFTIPNLVQISNLTDINLGTWTGGAVSGNITFCVFSTTGAYTIRPSSANGTGTDFRLVSGGNHIVYDVTWNDGGGATNLDHNTTSGAMNTSATSVDCNSGAANNTNLQVDITAAAAAAAPASATAYADTLTLLVTPQ